MESPVDVDQHHHQLPKVPSSPKVCREPRPLFRSRSLASDGNDEANEGPARPRGLLNIGLHK